MTGDQTSVLSAPQIAWIANDPASQRVMNLRKKLRAPARHF